MSDKSFGDHPNRNIVKNPLLSSAVTGLSIEDLTHKAVLLPVTPSQALITRPDQQQGSQTHTLEHSHHGTATLPSGDALQNTTLSNTTPVSTPNYKISFDNQNIVKHDKNRALIQSKASVKSEDDFDVNEYIARLQGTRYVSAPLRSHLKEDNNANLEATEENLEEINLNDSQSPVEIQQSLTADIAQNFSQLPAVLPHVASAVFSSFSNMLYKSREQTPDVNPEVDQRYNDVQFQRPEVGVPMHFEEFTAPKEVGPPPKEPPVGGSSNFRITTKKKYAQIPGLRSGDSQTMTFDPTPNMPFGQIPNPGQSLPPIGQVSQNFPPMGQSIPAGYTMEFDKNVPSSGQHVPPMGQVPAPIDHSIPANTRSPFSQNVPLVQNEVEIDQKPPQFVQSASIGQTYSAFVPNIPSIGTNVGTNVSTIFTPDPNLDTRTEIKNAPETQYNMFNPGTDQSKSGACESGRNAPVNTDSNNFFTPIEHKENVPSSATIIPPPPMFSNLSKRDGAAGKSILPPSVARRISANQPIIKPQVSATSFTENIFIPTIPAETTSQNTIPGYSTSAFVPAFPIDPMGPPNVPPNIPQKEEKPQSSIPPFFTPKNTLIDSTAGLSINPSAIPSHPANTTVPGAPSHFELSNCNIPSTISGSGKVSPPYFTSEAAKSDSSSQSISQFPESKNDTVIKSASSQPAQNLPPGLFFNPTQYTESKDIAHSITQLPPNPEPPRPVPEPPKATAGNFRMTKKRPQYYAGPIEGVGDISNNVKPIIHVTPNEGSFQGALFTPAAVEQATEQYAVSNIGNASVPFDISRPVGVTPEKPIEYNMPQDYSAFHLRQSQNQSYEQDNNTSFDLSRATTEAFGEPKEDSTSTGFGIIGSLKSKLSSIDINKIQNTVTTFFDPAYNDTRVPDPVSQENQSLLQFGQSTQHFGNDQSNLEIFVSNQTSNNSYDQNQYYQTQQYYGQDYSSSYFSDPNANQARNDNSSNIHTHPYTQQNIPEKEFKNVDSSTFYNPNEFKQNILSSNIEPPYVTQDQGKVPLTMEVKNQENITFFNATSTQNLAQEFKNIPEVSPFQQKVDQYATSKSENIASFYNNPSESSQQPSKEKFSLDATENYPNTNIGQPPSPAITESQMISFYNPNVFTPQVQQVQTTGRPLDVTQCHQANSSTINKTSNATIMEPSNVDRTVDSALNTTKYNLSSIQTPPYQPGLTKVPLDATNFFDSPQTLNLQFSAENVDKKYSESAYTKYETKPESKTSFDPVPAIDVPIAPIGSKTKTVDLHNEELTRKRNLIESLSKDQIPVLGVSSVPLFGISALIADKTETDAENVSNYDKKSKENLFSSNVGASFFENVSKEQNDNKPKNPSDLEFSALKISDVKNVLLIEPPHENIVAVLKRNASSSKLEAKTDDIPEQFRQNIPSTELHQDQHKNVIIDTQNASFFEHVSPAKNDDENVMQQAAKGENESVDSELNICETCREVNTPDLETKPKESDDLTSQLIENITSRMSLSHPLTVPLSESDTPEEMSKMPQFSDQLQEITDIAEDTIETLQVQSATDLLDDEITSEARYGWTEDASYSSTALGGHGIDSDIKEHDYGFKMDAQMPPVADHDYEFKLDPNSIGFFGNNSLFFENVPQNASDEIKAEIKHSHEDIVLPRQISTPSAPPAEDDTKSDETGGLDVHSIEQDAKMDFPLDEEFIIEPSGTDDDKIEFRERKRSSEDSISDTFTNRVERFKKGSDVFNDDTFEQKETQYNSPPISMASYFDTGNYAVESHFKNSASPVPNYHHHPSSYPYEFVSIPPGFEEQYMNLFKNVVPNAPQVPETSTQTKTTLTATFSAPQDTHHLKTDTHEVTLSGTGTELKISEVIRTHLPSNVAQNVPVPDTMNYFTTKEEVKKETQDEVKPATQEAPESFNRLASYFSMPAPQPDHSKSFFELSESQNHYRHESKTKEDKSFFELSQSQNHYIDDVTKNNIADLMMDLTSPQNLREQIVTTINHFTIEHDNNVSKNAVRPIKIDLHDLSKNTTSNIDKPKSSKTDDVKLVENDCEDTNTILNCKYCANYLKFPLNFKVRTAMNETSEAKSAVVMSTDKTPDKKSVSINIEGETGQQSHHAVNVLTEPRITSEYAPVKHHWFYRVDVEEKSVWRGFSATDSRALEESFNSPSLDENTLVPTDGGRFDVNIVGRLRIAVYWQEKPTNVRRCSWFYKGTTDPRYVPYTEAVAEKLEEEYRHGVLTGEWHRKLSLPNSEMVIMHGPSVMVHFLQSSATDAFTTPPATSRPRVVRRGHEESEIEDCEPSRIEHLLLLCHGVGSACDLRFRSVEEVVDDFRTTSFQLLQSHYKNSYDSGIVNRIEVLPISWHAQLHSGETGVDSRLSRVTLDSIPRLRAFTNNTVLDVLFYTSPVFHQVIIDTVCSEMNRVYSLFKARNPEFKGEVSLGGHSLGSVILYDLLCNQIPESSDRCIPTKTYVSTVTAEDPPVNYPQLKFHPAALYALGSPISIFECIRGVESLGLNFQLPTCKHFFNIFHPYDPIAYRIEPLINSDLQRVKPDLIPHHKGRKRMHLELKDTMTRVGADLKQKLIESVRTTWNKWTAQPIADGHLEKVVEEEIEKEQLCDDKVDKTSQMHATKDMLGKLNNGRRIDYVLQEAPLEMINEYLFAMSSHVGYWESEDTMLLMLREVYSSLGVQPDCTVPQQCMTVHRTTVDDASLMSEKESPSTSRGRAS